MAVCFAAGILLGRAASVWIWGAAGGVFALAAFFLSEGRRRFCACLALAVSLGCLRGYFAFHPSLPAEGTYSLTGIVCDEVEFRNGRQIRTLLRHVTLDGVPSADAYWSFYTEEAPADLAPGKAVSFQARLYHPSGPVNPDGYNFREELLRRGVEVGVYGNQELIISDPGFFSLRGWMASLRHQLIRALVFSPLGEEAGSYAAAMLFGSRSLVPLADRTAFSRLGIAHILSVSGFHVGVLIGLLAGLFRLLRLPQKLRLGLYALVLGVYVLLCGSAQPVLRASLLLLLSQRGRMLNRPRSLLHLLSAVFLLMLALSPVQLTGLSFCLSFGAVAGLALITPFLEALIFPPEDVPRPRPSGAAALLQRLRASCARFLRSALSAGLGAQIGILLPELYAFQELPLLGLLLNIPVFFISALLISLYWAALLTLSVPGLSALICAAGRLATSLLLSVVRFLSSLPGITLWTKAPGLLSVLGVLLLTAGLCRLFRWRPRSRLLLSGCGLLILALSLIPLPHYTSEYVQFSVGDADAALLWDQDQALVIDAGYEDGALSDYLHRRRLTPSAVILTHLHSDHVWGLRTMREDGIPIPVVYLPDGAEQADIHPDVLQLLADLKAGGTSVRHLSAGDRIPLPSGEIRVVWPERGKTRPGQNANESSLVLQLRLKGTTLLQTGDLDGRYEMYAAYPADLLKVPHHGSSSSSSDAFLASVDPAVALLSCGDLERHSTFRQRLPEDAVLFSTAAHGMLTVRFLENTFTVETFLPGPEELTAPPGEQPLTD